MKYVGRFLSALGATSILVVCVLSTLLPEVDGISRGHGYTVKNTQDAPEEIRSEA
ncbi:MAG: hypothetical protein WCJ17_01245 [bacterium]